MKTDVTSRAPSCLGLAAKKGGQASDAGLTAYARTLARIEAALARMEKGQYGFCLTCEKRIALPRLEADPAEAVCGDCDEGEKAGAALAAPASGNRVR